MRFGILGPLQVSVGRTEVALARRGRILLAILLLHANRTVSQHRITDAIWGAHPPAGSAGQVHASVYQLRRRLAAAGAPHDLIVTDPAGYRARVGPQGLDLTEFRGFREKARTATASERLADGSAHYRAALELWRGPALDGVDSEIIRQAAASLEEEHLQTVEEYIETELSLGRGREVVAELTDLVQRHPHREGLHRSLMVALYRAGRQADALTAYRHIRQLLHDDLAIEPGHDLQNLHQAILNRDPELDLTPTPPRPQPAEGDRSLVPRELPADVAGFIGRDAALKTLDELLFGPPDLPPSPVVITGTAGVGKTALAVHWAHRVADHFPDGQLYVNLRGHSTDQPVHPGDALPALLRSLGTPPEQIPTDEAEAAARYRSQLAGRRVLVVLDNAASVEQVRTLLPGSPGCLVLSTSRNRLTGLVARDGACAVELDIFTPDEAMSLLSRNLGAARVDAEPDAAAALARACAHLALALRIAAASLAERPHWTVGSYVAELTAGDPLTTLQAEGDRKSAVRGALELSYNTIPADARQLFRLLGLVPGTDFTAPAAATLAGFTAEGATRALQHLAGAHLITEHLPGRYGFHDLLRLYAGQLAEVDESDDERAAAVDRLLGAYLRTTDAAAGLLYPQMLRLSLPNSDAKMLAPLNRRLDALAWLDAERANLVAAVTITARDRLKTAPWLLADRLRGYFWHGRHTSEWLTVAAIAVTAAKRDGDSTAEAASQFNLGHLCQSVARHDDALMHYTTAYHHAGSAGWSECQVAALSNLGMIYQDLGRLDDSADRLSQALALNQEQANRGGQAISRINLGFVDRQRGRLREAAHNLTQALAMNRELGYQHGEAAAAAVLGQTYLAQGRLDAAQDLLGRAQDLYRETGDRAGETGALHGLAAVHDGAGRSHDACELAQRAVALADKIGDSRGHAEALNALGSAQLHLGRGSLALGHHRDALDLARQAKVRYSETAALVGLAAARYLMGELEQASELADHAIAIARDVGYRVLEGQATTLLAEILFSQREHGKARERATRALDIHRQTGHRIGEARTLAVLGHVQHATDGPAAAAPAWQAAYELFTDVGAPVPDDLARQLKGD